MNYENEYRIAAIDYGKKRIGYAYTDLLKIIVAGTDLIINDDNTIEKFKMRLSKDNVGTLVVGLPIRDDNKNDIFILEIYKFIDELKKNCELNIEFIDESFSSTHAVLHNVNSGMKKSKRKSKGTIDKVAAALILQEYLETRK